MLVKDVLDLIDQGGSFDIVPLDLRSIFPRITSPPILVCGPCFRALAPIGGAVFVTLGAGFVLFIDRGTFILPGTSCGTLCILCHTTDLLSQVLIS